MPKLCLQGIGQMKTEQGHPRQKEQHGQRLRGSEAVQSGWRLGARLGGVWKWPEWSERSMSQRDFARGACTSS